MGGAGLGVGFYRGARRAWRGTDKLRHPAPYYLAPSLTNTVVVGHRIAPKFPGAPPSRSCRPAGYQPQRRTYWTRGRCRGSSTGKEPNLSIGTRRLTAQRSSNDHRNKSAFVLGGITPGGVRKSAQTLPAGAGAAVNRLPVISRCVPDPRTACRTRPDRQGYAQAGRPPRRGSPASEFRRRLRRPQK